MTKGDMSEAALGTAAQLLARRVGLRLDSAIRGRLARSVADEAAARDLDIPAYVARLDSDPALLQDLLNRVTVQETAFFRDPGQFAAFATRILPDLPSPVRVWSAACANGQEPYSLAIVLAESGISSWSVIATDLSTRALTRTSRARYSEREMSGVNNERRDAYFVRTGTHWEVAAPLRQRVQVLHHNLVTDPPPFTSGGCDVVFCRNVLIYLRPEDVIAYLERLALWLAPEAWLFLGYSESLWHLTDRFRLVRVDDAFVYRPRDDRSAAPPVASRPRPVERAARPSPLVTTTRDRRAAPPRPPAVETVGTGAGVVELLAAGEAAMNARDFGAAISAFRKCAYLDPDEPIAHLHLGLALEGAGETAAARRAYGTARSVLGRGTTAAVEALLEGYAVTDLRQLLDDKLGGTT